MFCMHNHVLLVNRGLRLAEFIVVFTFQAMPMGQSMFFDHLGDTA